MRLCNDEGSMMKTHQSRGSADADFMICDESSVTVIQQGEDRGEKTEEREDILNLHHLRAGAPVDQLLFLCKV
jgi:hypothetical protein